MHKAIIIDDEEMARVLLNGMLAEYCPEIQVTELCQDLPSGVKAIRKHKPDIVFLDIEMPGHSGLELLDFFDENEVEFSIIFVTAYNRYAIQAFKLSAVDYILKPIEADDLMNAVALFKKNNTRKNYSLLKNNLTVSQPKKMRINTVNSVSFVTLDDILFFQADGAYTKVILKEGKIIVASKGLKYFENVLSGNTDFFRCHKSFIVNVHCIAEWVKSDGGYLKINEHQIAVANDKIDALLEIIG